MILRLDPESTAPIFEQIVLQVKYAVARGALRPGDRLPSVRQMSTTALVNPNTVAKAYRELEREGIVRTQRGLGVFVAAKAPRVCARDGRAAVDGRLGRAIRDAAQAGLSPDEIRRMVDEHVEEAFSKAQEPNR